MGHLALRVFDKVDLCVYQLDEEAGFRLSKECKFLLACDLRHQVVLFERDGHANAGDRIIVGPNIVCKDLRRYGDLLALQNWDKFYPVDNVS